MKPNTHIYKDANLTFQRGWHLFLNMMNLKQTLEIPIYFAKFANEIRNRETFQPISLMFRFS